VKLTIPSETFNQQLLEFDVWVTPELTDISTTDKYKAVMAQVRGALESAKNISELLKAEESQNLPIGEAVATAYSGLVIEEIRAAEDYDEALQISHERLSGLAATLFLVTGKSDNNNKCQFPLYLQRTIEWQSLPSAKKRTSRGVVRFELSDQKIPRVLKAETYMETVASLFAVSLHSDLAQRAECARHATNLLAQFVSFILSDNSSKEQFLGMVSLYHELKTQERNPETLLAPLVRFQVRGSVSATGGHEPEEILRERLTDWGLKRDRDFNIADVVLDLEAGRILENTERESEEVKRALPAQDKSKKTRAYDFVLPFRTDGWSPRLFIQAQFYAGDSGSVSHKVVDQTTASRNSARQLLAMILHVDQEPRFIEYVDGAGYFASLNGDLKKILKMPDTKSFFQVKSSPIRLRRELQDIGYLTPLEVEHALLLTGSESGATERLISEGYTEAEVLRVLEDAKARGIFETSGHQATVSADRADIARRYLLLDLIARRGSSFGTAAGLKGVILVPGYGPYHGIRLSALGQLLSSEAPTVWTSPALLCDDLAWLAEQGFTIQR
jgi:hypothetical protein